MTIQNSDGRPLEFQVPCRKCWKCNKKRVDDYTGRCLAEAVYSRGVTTLTLTYAPRDDGAEKHLKQAHFQAFIRALRRSGHLVRYIGVAERGSRGTNRIHFHTVLFWGSKPPSWASGHTHIKEWPHGHVMCDHSGSERAIRYTIKYLLKGASLWYTLSKKPSLGSAFFNKHAEAIASTGVFPTSFKYRVPGSERVFTMSGSTRRDFLIKVTDLLTVSRPPDLARLNEAVGTVIDAAHVWQRKRIEETGFDPLEDFRLMREALDSKKPDPHRISAMLRRLTSLEAWSNIQGAHGEEWTSEAEELFRDTFKPRAFSAH